MRSFRYSRVLVATAALATIAATVAFVPGGSAIAAAVRSAKAVVHDVSGASLGTVTLQPVGTKLRVSGRLTRLTPGFHGFHIHSVGICDPNATDPTGTVVPFASAGGHLNPAGATHGHHAGDLPLLYVSADGVSSALVDSDSATFAAIFDADGAAVIVHANPDNYANIPPRYSAAGVPGPDTATLATGDAGGRVACGVIVR
jgi:Cu-Zn family superoxide dismutase